MKFLVHPKPFKDESLKGYIARIATLNGCESPSWVYQEAGLTGKKNKIINANKISPSKVSLKMLAELTDTQESELWNLTFYNEFGDFEETSFNNTIINYLKMSSLNNLNTKICPLCLKENLYFRKLWELTIYNVCHKHNCLMVCKCPKCNSNVNLRISPIGQCECGFEYKAIKPIYVSDDYSELEKAINEKITINSFHKEFDNKLTNLDFRLFVYLVVDLSKLLKRQNNSSGVNLELTFDYNESSLAYKAFSNWPQEFYNFIEFYNGIHKEKNNIESFGLKEFGSLISIINRYKKLDSNFHFIVDEFETYVLQEWEGVLRVGGIAVNPIAQKRKWTFSEEAAKQLNIGRNSLQYLLEKGILKARIFDKGTRKYVAISNESIDEYKTKLKEEISFKEASEILNIHTSKLNEIVEAGIVKKGNLSFKGKKVYKSSVYSLLSDINSKEKSYKGVKGNLLDFQTTLKMFNSSGKSIVELINSIMEVEITPIKNDKSQIGLQGLIFLDAEIKKYLKIEKLYNIKQINKQLKVGEEVVVNWINKGILIGKYSKDQLLVNEKDLSDFLEKYILLSEVSNLIGSSKNTKRLLSKYNILPVSGRVVDGSSRYLFQREEVEHFIASYLELASGNLIDNEEVYSVKDLSQLLNIPKNNLYRLIQNNVIFARKVKGQLLISESDVTLFKENYIKIKEISQKIDISDRIVKSYLDKENINPVYTEDINGSTKYLYNRKEVELFISSCKHTDKLKLDYTNVYFIQQLVDELDSSRQVIYHWINKGLLKGNRIQKELWVTQEDLNQFKEKYIMLKEIGQKINVYPLLIPNILTKYKVIPVTGNTFDGEHKYLYDRKEVEAFISSYFESNEQR